MAIKRIVSLSFLFLLGNSYLSAMDTKITESQIKNAKIFINKKFSVFLNCCNDHKHNIKTLQIGLIKNNEIDIKCSNGDKVLVLEKKVVYDSFTTWFRPPYSLQSSFPRTRYMGEGKIPFYECSKGWFDSFDVFQKLYQLKKLKREKNKKYITILSLCRNSKTE